MLSRTDNFLYKVAYLIFLGLILSSTEDRYYEKGDERANLSNVTLLKEQGFGEEYLNAYYGLSGPVYPFMQYVFLPVTQGKVNLMRAVNGLALLLLIYLLSCFSDLELNAWMLMTVPVTYLCAGYAMTTIPSLIFLIPSFYLLFLYINSTNPAWNIFFSGFFLSLAILTRLNLLILLPVWCAFLICQHKNDLLRGSAVVLYLLLGSLPLLLYVFSVWKSIIPPVAAVSIGNGFADLLRQFDISKILKTTGIVGLIYILFNFRWLLAIKKKWRSSIIVLITTLLLGNYYLNVVNYLPAQVLWSRPGLDQRYLYVLGNLIGSGLLLLVIWLFLSGVNWWHRNTSLVQRSAMLTILAIIISTGFAPQVFSSRYAYQAVPFILLTAGVGSETFNKLLRLLGLLGGFIIYFSFREYNGLPYIDF